MAGLGRLSTPVKAATKGRQEVLPTRWREVGEKPVDQVPQTRSAVIYKNANSSILSMQCILRHISEVSVALWDRPRQGSRYIFRNSVHNSGNR